MDIKGKQPSPWGANGGAHRDSVGSNASRVQWDQLERRPSGESTAASGTWSRMPGELRRRRWA
jgi:vesicular inhibitory amino acid transporter